MSLVHKPEMTEENLAAHRANGQLTHMLLKVRKGALAEKEGENEGTSGDVYEKKGQQI